MDGKIGVSADEKIYELSKDEVIFFRPMTFHKLWSADNTKPHLFIISFVADGTFCEKIDEKVYILTQQQKNIIKDLISTFREQSEDNFFTEPTEAYLKTWYDSPKITQLIGNYLENFILLLDDMQHPLAAEKVTSKTKIYKRIVEIMNDNIYGWITIGDIAAKCNISVANMKRVFAEFSNYGIHKHFLNMKIIRAIEMIKDGKRLSEISMILGFNNQNYFSAVFKRETGYSPSMYKDLFIFPSTSAPPEMKTDE